MTRTLEPVGEHVCGPASEQDVRRLLAELQPYGPRWFESGTAALAAAIVAARQEMPAGSRGEVLIPAYCCPDIVSAAVAAGVTPVPVDFEPDKPQLALERVADALSPKTVAIVAVSFLGLPERLAEIRALLPAVHRPQIIFDACQAHPDAVIGNVDADHVVFSFGRGKPISALGGGLLLSREPQECTAAGALDAAPPTLRWRLLAAAFNFTLSARLYGFLERVPGLGVGKTRYRKLERIEPLADWRMGVIAGNWLASRRHDARIADEVREISRSTLFDVASSVAGGDRCRLLRVPLLAPSPEAKERLLPALRHAGLGASRMYPKVLQDMPVIAELVSGRQCTAARDFCRRLITLPSHSRVRPPHLARLAAIIAPTKAALNAVVDSSNAVH